MAQEYNEILPGGSTNILQDNIDSRKNDEALRSGFSGSTFPTSPIPVAGQRCYREDLKKEYIFNGESWVEVASSGAIAQEVTLARGTHAKLQDRLGVSMNPDGTLKTPATANVDEFKVSGFEPTYVSANSFSVPGDTRAIFTEGRRLKITQGAETIYPAVVSSSYNNEADKTTIVIDGITITTEITTVDFSMVQYGLPLASETVKGVVEVGANLSVDSGVISVPEATEAVKGVVELATPAEVLAGEDDERAVTVKDLDYSYATFDSDRIYDGVDLETKFAAEIASYSDVWAWLKARKDAVNYSGLHIGDYVQFTVGADTVQAQIAGIDTYYRTGDAEIGHHIDWVSRDCLLTPRQWNTTNINNGNASNPCPYMVSDLKASLDGLITSLPVGLQAVIVPKRMLLESRYTSGSTLIDSTSWKWSDLGKLWIPSEFEVFGSIVWGTRGYSQNGGVQYPIFANGWKSRQKGAGHNGSRSSWWLLSVHGGASTHCCNVGASGHPSNTYASNALGVPLCFRIG